VSTPEATAPAPAAESAPATLPCTLGEFLLYFVKLGTTGFGGPIALAGYMQRDLVEERRWISKEDYKDGLALAQLAPGPLAAQLAMYLGWVRAGVLGATLVAFAFILPSFFMVVGLAALYVKLGGLSWMQGAFYGVGAAVIAIIARSAVKLVGMTIGRDRLLWAIFIANALTTAWTETEIVWVFILSGLVAVLANSRVFVPSATTALVIPPWLLMGIKGEAPLGTLGDVLLYFTQAGAFVFGSGLAIVPFLYGGVVKEYGWLTEKQFLDAVAVGMITPGPVVITAAFIGFLVAGASGSVAAAIGTFLPCYLFVIIPAPWFRRVKNNPRIKAFVDGVTSAATGAIAGAAFVLGRRAIADVPAAIVAVVTLAILLKTKKVPEPVLIVAAAIVGILAKTATH
jgi:chromate transporter